MRNSLTLRCLLVGCLAASLTWVANSAPAKNAKAVESSRSAEQLFALIDTNHDGTVTVEELRAFKPHRRGGLEELSGGRVMTASK